MLVNLRALLVRLIDIILLRGGPEQLPASPGLLTVVVATYLAISSVTCSLLPKEPQNWQIELLVGAVFTLLWFRAAFSLAKKPERFLQTSTAFFAITALFAPALIPITTEMQLFIVDPDHNPFPPAGHTLLATVLGLWVLTVQVRIVRVAYEWPFIGAILFLFGMTFASALVYGMLFGVPVKTV